jgi:hypothetical protein
MAAAVTMSTATDVTPGTRTVAPRAGRSDRHTPAELGVLEEPVELLAELRVAARERPAAARANAPGLLAQHAAEAWEDELDALGVPAPLVVHAFETCRREIWLWVDGDRRWQQLAPHLARRVLRRTGHAAP